MTHEPTASGPDRPDTEPLTSGLSSFPRNERAEAAAAHEDRVDRKRSLRKVIGWVVGPVLALAISFGLAISQGNSEKESMPVVGECAKPVGKDDLAKVGCSEPSARYEVVGRSEKDVDARSFCSDFSRTTEYFTFSSSSHSVDVAHLVLCLAPVKSTSSNT